MQPPSKRLVLFFDGTDNTPKDRTNVWRTHELLADADGVGVRQLKYYIKGVGTDVGEIAAGSIFGSGIARKIREGYTWLAQNFEDGDEIYVFGFSRGAFAARSTIQLISCCGLTRKEALGEWSAEQAFDWYEAISRHGVDESHPIWRLRYWQRHPDGKPADWVPSPEEQVLGDDTKIRVVKVKMAGLWDTVGALGIDTVQNQGALTQKSAAHNVRPTRALENSYHALSISEHRPMFDVTLWRTFVVNGTEAETMARYTPYHEQRWFVGAHSDVGGGYNDDEDSLPDLSLSWMLKKASALGLKVTTIVEPQPGGWRSKIHDSFESFAGGVLSIWDKIIPGDQRHYREIGRIAKAVTTDMGVQGALWSINETIDESVICRWIEDPTYRPPGLVDYFRRNPTLLPAGTSAAQRTKRIYAHRYWNETGVHLRAGIQYRITVVPGLGEPLRDASYTARGIEGEDWSSFAHKAAALLHGKRKDDAKWFALIGTVDKKQPWVISDSGLFKVPIGGQMICYFNDVQMEAFYANNAGWIVLEIAEVY